MIKTNSPHSHFDGGGNSNNNELTGFKYNGLPYYYRKNLFGDIIEIYDDENQLAASYTYDAWGNFTVGTNVDGIAFVNKFRYRGYYYDSDTGYYYLQTRYYDPQMGRFLNADEIGYLDPETIHGCNLYAYCKNNPIMGIDPMGTFELFTLIAIAALVVLSIVDEIISDKWDGEPKKDIHDCIEAWGASNHSESTENGAIIMSTVIDGETYYYIDRTYYGGFSVVLPFIFSYIKYGIQSLLGKNKQMVGFVHTHPLWCPYNPSAADNFISTLPGMNNMYIVGPTGGESPSSNPLMKKVFMPFPKDNPRDKPYIVSMKPYDYKGAFLTALWDMICAIPGYFD